MCITNTLACAVADPPKCDKPMAVDWSGQISLAEKSFDIFASELG